MFTYEQVLSVIEQQIVCGQQLIGQEKLLDADNTLDLCQKWLGLLIILDGNVHLANSIAVNERIFGLRKQIKERRAAITPVEFSDIERR